MTVPWSTYLYKKKGTTKKTLILEITRPRVDKDWGPEGGNVFKTGKFQSAMSQWLSESVTNSESRNAVSYKKIPHTGDKESLDRCG